jgi:hypothetical protein
MVVRLSRPAYVESRTLQGEGAMPDHLPGSDANSLYWETNASVSEIADQLAISRRALYDAIEPRPADVPCAECGAGLVFRNRTAAERRRAECLECEIEVALAEMDGAEEAGASARRATPRAPAGPADPARSGATPVKDWSETIPGNGAVLGGSLLAGLALGAAAGYLIRKR